MPQPGDIVSLGGNLSAGFQNGVGSQGQTSTSGNIVTHYAYAQSPLPQQGGTDAASAPGTGGKAPASAPAVFVVTLTAAARTAAVAPLS